MGLKRSHRAPRTSTRPPRARTRWAKIVTTDGRRRSSPVTTHQALGSGGQCGALHQQRAPANGDGCDRGLAHAWRGSGPPSCAAAADQRRATAPPPILPTLGCGALRRHGKVRSASLRLHAACRRRRRRRRCQDTHRCSTPGPGRECGKGGNGCSYLDRQQPGALLCAAVARQAAAAWDRPVPRWQRVSERFAAPDQPRVSLPTHPPFWFLVHARRPRSRGQPTSPVTGQRRYE